MQFDGSGWVYLGEAASKNGVRYESRSSADGIQRFIFKAEKAGNYKLNFYRKGTLQNEPQEDQAAVLVHDQTPQKTAPQEETVQAEPAPREAAPQTETSQAEAAAPAAESARVDAREKPDVMGSEELWQEGQRLEAQGPDRNIRGALECYRRVLREFPQSVRAEDARKRIAYLERFYFNLR